MCYTWSVGNHRAKGDFTPLVFCGGYYSPLDERKEGDIQWLHIRIYFYSVRSLLP